MSRKEWDQIKIILKIDEDLFKPSDYGSFSPHSMIVDVSKYENLSKDAKEILYRPPKVKNLYEKYWQLCKVCLGKEKEEKDREILRDYYPRFPKKKPEEYIFVD